ncbi:cyclic nucleotide-binding domain-containing protein [Chloroflexota bacterium]
MKKVEVMKKSDVFSHLNKEDLAEVAKFCRYEEFEAGTTIFRQDTASTDIYVVEDGLVSIMLELGQTDRRQIQAVSDFGCFSWTALVPPCLHICMAKALEKTKVLAFDGKQLRELVNTNPRLCAEVMAGIAFVMAQKLRLSFTQLMGVTYQD